MSPIQGVRRHITGRTTIGILAWTILILDPLGDFAAARADEKATAEPTFSATVTSGEMLHQYLLDRVHERLDARKQEVTGLKTPEEIQARAARLREFFRESLGELPNSENSSPLNGKVVGVLEKDGYRVEKVIFESRPRHHVTASLYLPERQAAVPRRARPVRPQRQRQGGEPYQRICILLAKNGMAVLCYDPIGQGERVQMLDAEGKPAIREGSTTEHTMAGIGALLVGRQAASYRIWDGIRALDYLASRPEVDADRLGCTGNSGGGTMTAYLMALDDRIAVAAPSCYITSLERLFATIGPQDAEQNITGQVAAGLDHADYVTMRAPKPTLLSRRHADFFDIQGSWDTFREVKLLYGRLGFGERVDLFESDEPHGFTQPAARRRRALAEPLAAAARTTRSRSPRCPSPPTPNSSAPRPARS